MKKRFFTVAALLTISTSVLFTSCIGPFNLTSKLLAWNQTIDNKFVNAIIFVVLSPAYGITLIGDALIFNSLEFWTGENPIEAGIVKKVEGQNGIYTVETLENGYRVTDPQGAEARFVYDKESNVWSLEANETSTKLLKVKDNNTAIVYLPGGGEQQVELSQNGLMALQQTVQNEVYYAQK